jgi:hypothetical protein
MSNPTVTRGPARGVFTAALAAVAIAWSQAASAVAVPVLYVSVDGAPEVSFEFDQACDGTKAVVCVGTGVAGDLLIDLFELTADPDPYVTAAMSLYNSSLSSTISVVATVLFPLVGSYASPDVGLGTGLVNNVFGGGIFNLTVEALVDPPSLPLAFIDEASPGVPLSVCEDLGFDPACQSVVGVSLAQSGPGTLDVLSYIALRLTFDLSPDTAATIGLAPGEDFDGAAYFSVTPQAAVPLPAAAWMLLSGLGTLLALRRKAASAS